MSEMISVRIGGRVDGVVATLRVSGADLDPDDVTRSLGRPPTTVESGPTSTWILAAPPTEPPDIDVAIRALLDSVSADGAVWGELTRLFDVEVRCALYLEHFNREGTVSPATSRALRERHVPLRLDIHAPTTRPVAAAYPGLVPMLQRGELPEPQRLRAGIVRELASGYAEELELYVAMSAAVLDDVQIFHEVVRRMRQRRPPASDAGAAARLIEWAEAVFAHIPDDLAATFTTRLRGFAATLPAAPAP